MIDLDKLGKFIDDAIAKETPESIAEFFKEEEIPKGWVSIDDHLPKFKAKDVHRGYSIYTVRNAKGKKTISCVSDHHAWYANSKEYGITHWLNE